MTAIARCRRCRRPLRVPSTNGYGPHCWRLVRPETPPKPVPVPEPPKPATRRSRRPRSQIPGQTQIHLDDRTDTMPKTAVQRVAEFLPELADCPDDPITAQLGAQQFADDIQTVIDERDEAVEHLRRVVGHQDDPCRFNHHGRCEIHAVDGPELGKCGIAEAREWVAALPAEDGSES